ncbi:MAG: cytochrome c [Myxococcales bacterium]|nr:cytochrome c [Myxococcales bacterium]
MIALVFAAALAQAQTPSPAPIVGQQSAQDVWDKRCTFCHGQDGKAHTKKGRQYKAEDFTKAKWQKHTTDEEIVDAITNGVPKTKMPAFKEKLSPAEIKSMVPFVRAFGAKK